MDDYEAAVRFLEWMERRITTIGRGDDDSALEVEPDGKYWLGRLASKEQVMASGLGDRGERLEPCAIGVRVRTADRGPWTLQLTVHAAAWLRKGRTGWRKYGPRPVAIRGGIESRVGAQTLGREVLESELTALTGTVGLSAEIVVELEQAPDGNYEMMIMLVNTSPQTHAAFKDTRLYECALSVSGIKTVPFLLESLPDSFRYDRRVAAYGLNCGVVLRADGTLETVDAVGVSRQRPRFWPTSVAEPRLTFEQLGTESLESLRAMEQSLAEWGNSVWSSENLDRRAAVEGWAPAMREEAGEAAKRFWDEHDRVRTGINRLDSDRHLRRAFQLMNRAMLLAVGDRYSSWRPFQLGFLLANLGCIANPESEANIVDIVWFATGGGKTETYLGLLLTAAFHDRLLGKGAGVTAWSRFPLRMLSLQQTQRFANAIAGAERVRRLEGISGDSFSLGFFVGQGATPNSIDPEPRPGDPWDPDDEEMPRRVQVLEECPFCRRRSIEMSFNRVLWKLEHRCISEECPWPEEALPLYVVDDEVYRHLPTIVVGTLDKAASIGMQASMRGLVGPPLGFCTRPGHGYTYAPRGKRPKGCLVPGCTSAVGPLPYEAGLYAPSFRLQDELHLLRDSLGAVDGHYEAVFDSIQMELCGRIPKVLASSATLTGYEKQVDVLYRRTARIFPQPGPSPIDGFWSMDSEALMRRYVAIAPRGVTIEYTVDRVLTELQRAIRRLHDDAEAVCAEVGIDLKFAPLLLSIYGTDVVYGNTLRDLDAVSRSVETQVEVSGPVNTVSLTGRTQFDEVRTILRRLENPEPAFEDRLHLISASSMMSHGVDVDRLNVMVMLGLPLGTAEFIQTTARIGRRWPGIVFVVHKIGRERDAGVYRAFEKFIQQGDRLLEPVPITRRSRRVLDRTIAGLELARMLMVHEPKAGIALTTIGRLRDWALKSGLSMDAESAAMMKCLALESSLDVSLREDIARWFARFGRNLVDPPPDARFPSDLSPTGPPMRSLRDVEEEAPVFGSLIR